jgi:hypothetical protein
VVVVMIVVVVAVLVLLAMMMLLFLCCLFSMERFLTSMLFVVFSPGFASPLSFKSV